MWIVWEKNMRLKSFTNVVFPSPPKKHMCYTLHESPKVPADHTTNKTDIKISVINLYH